jgi:1,4-alpha-glucan branching enzyme
MTSITRDGSVEFRFFRPGARLVAVMGDFNEWGKDALTMCDDGGGWWSAACG